MKTNIKKACLLLITLVTTLLFVPAAFADEKVSLLFNSQEYQADVYVEKGSSYVSVESLQKIPGLTIEKDGYVKLREFFENGGGNVDWNNAKKQIIVSWREKNDKWTADELMVESSNASRKLNTYKMKGNASMEMTVSGPNQEIPEVPEITTSMDGVFQQDPLAMYLKQTVKLPVEDTELSEEEAALFPEGDIVTEMVWTDNAIYQKMPLSDQWIVQDLGDMDMMGNLTNMLQTSPQQSLEMMRKFGIIYVFGEDVVIDGQEYYTVKNYIDSASFKKVMEEFMGGPNMAGLIADSQTSSGENEEEMAASREQMQQVLDQMLATMELNYYVDSFVNKETLLTNSMKFDMEMKYAVDEKVSPEGPVKFNMKMTGDYELYDYGAKIQLPDVSNTITQEEYMEQMMSTMEIPAE